MTNISTRANHPSIPDNRDILVYIFQRGAADGLNSLVPVGDSDYYNKRASIAVGESEVIGLDGFFGLHPALSPLKSIYDQGDLCLIHATGIPHGSRSHFAAQTLVEQGIDQPGGASSGWLGRHLSLQQAASESAFRAIAISGNVPVSLQGAANPLAIANLVEFGFDQDIIDSGYPTVLNDLYLPMVPFSGPAQAALAALQELQAAQPGNFLPDNGAVYPVGSLGDRLKQAAQLIKSPLPVEIVCLDSDDWDHHESLPFYLNQSLSELAQALTAFYTDMGEQMSRITVIVHSEFGRRVAENASLGVDHGTAGLCYAMGRGVNGGIVSDWPGLATQDLELGEDLRITTDLRSVFVELLQKRLAAVDASAIFPEFNNAQTLNIFNSL